MRADLNVAVVVNLDGDGDVVVCEIGEIECREANAVGIETKS
jgi:hypothetical protein